LKKSLPAIDVCNFHVELGVGADDVEVLVVVVLVDVAARVVVGLLVEVELLDVRVFVVERVLDIDKLAVADAVVVDRLIVEVELPAGDPLGRGIHLLTSWPGIRRWKARRGWGLVSARNEICRSRMNESTALKD
jgi:hypothetical protein